jgi:hypothetical protein
MLAGCATQKPKQTSKSASAASNSSKSKPTRETVSVGKVVRVNGIAKFVVLNYPVSSVPGADQHLSVYRQGLKVGELKVTGPQQDEDTVADIVSGEAQVGDETRAQ